MCSVMCMSIELESEPVSHIIGHPDHVMTRQICTCTFNFVCSGSPAPPTYVGGLISDSEINTQLRQKVISFIELLLSDQSRQSL